MHYCMGTFGTIIGTSLAVVGFFFLIIITFVITTYYLWFLLFMLAAIIGGIGYGSLNSDKARRTQGHKNEYIMIGTAGLIGCILLTLFIFLFDANLSQSVVASPPFALGAVSLLVIAFCSSLSLQFGLALSISNLLAK